MEIYIICGIVLLMVLVIIRSMYETSDFVVTREKIIDNRFKSELKIVFFADFHNVCYGKNNEKLIETIDNEKADYIIIAGDMLVGKPGADYTNAKELIVKLCQNNNVIYVFGNHEIRMLDEEKYGDILTDYVKDINSSKLLILNDDSLEITRNGNIIKIYGLVAEEKYFSKFKKNKLSRDYISKKLGEVKKDEGQISFLIAHSPEFFDEYVEFGADYVFSGHNHGGFVRLPGIGGILSTGGILFPKYTWGIYKKNNTTMFVTRGLGNHTINLRLFNRPEIQVITFRNK